MENVENSNEDMITNSDGSFVLKGVSKAPVVLKAMLDGYDFDPIVIDKVEPNMELAVVQPTRFRLAGKVDRAGFSQEITVKFKDDKEDTIGKVSVTEKGLFSIYLPAAEVKKNSCNCNVMSINGSGVMEFRLWGVLKIKIFGQESTYSLGNCCMLYIFLKMCQNCTFKLSSM